jgi:hypothetical protein
MSPELMLPIALALKMMPTMPPGGQQKSVVRIERMSQSAALGAPAVPLIGPGMVGGVGPGVLDSLITTPGKQCAVGLHLIVGYDMLLAEMFAR